MTKQSSFTRITSLPFKCIFIVSPYILNKKGPLQGVKMLDLGDQGNWEPLLPLLIVPNVISKLHSKSYLDLMFVCSWKVGV